jgi:hypothetical protein
MPRSAVNGAGYALKSLICSFSFGGFRCWNNGNPKWRLRRLIIAGAFLCDEPMTPAAAFARPRLPWWKRLRDFTAPLVQPVMQWKANGGQILWTPGGIAFDPKCCCDNACAACKDLYPHTATVSFAGVTLCTNQCFALVRPVTPNPVQATKLVTGSTLGTFTLARDPQLPCCYKYEWTSPGGVEEWTWDTNGVPGTFPNCGNTIDCTTINQCCAAPSCGFINYDHRPPYGGGVYLCICGYDATIPSYVYELRATFYPQYLAVSNPAINLPDVGGGPYSTGFAGLAFYGTGNTIGGMTEPKSTNCASISFTTNNNWIDNCPGPGYYPDFNQPFGGAPVMTACAPSAIASGMTAKGTNCGGGGLPAFVPTQLYQVYPQGFFPCGHGGNATVTLSAT